jgi:hypothetical protein
MRLHSAKVPQMAAEMVEALVSSGTSKATVPPRSEPTSKRC